MLLCTIMLCAGLVGRAAPSLAHSLGGGAAPSPSALCQQAILAAQRSTASPAGLLRAMGLVESGRRDPVSGDWAPWPWTIDAAGQPAFFDTEQAAITAVRAFQARGLTSIDVGCMQINLAQHPAAFTTLEQAFDPAANALYAARFLDRLFDRTGDWARATSLYHSATPALAAAYQKRVQQVWPAARFDAPPRPASPARSALAAAWEATLPAESGSAVVVLFRRSLSQPPRPDEDARLAGLIR